MSIPTQQQYTTDEDRRVERRKSPAYGPTTLAEEIAQTPDKYLVTDALQAKRQMAKNAQDVKMTSAEKEQYKKDVNIEVKGRVWWFSWSETTGYYNPGYTGFE